VKDVDLLDKLKKPDQNGTFFRNPLRTAEGGEED
jgi:hypothetical protein